MEEINNLSKWGQFKSYVKSPPPDVIAKTEYTGHFLNILGILVVSIVLVIKGIWYIIFGFIFMTLVSWAQGMSALARYKVFKSFLPEETYEYILTDKSFTRIRQRILKKRYKKYVRFLILVSCFMIAVSLFGLQDYSYHNIKTYFSSIWYIIKVGLTTILFYFTFTYLIIANIILKVKREEYKDVIQKMVSKNTDA